MATKLHELLAVERDLAIQANKTRQDLMNTFDKKKHHFEEKRKTFTSNEEKAESITEEQSDIQTTVADEAKWISEKVAKMIDLGFQIDLANTTAECRADVIADDGTVLLKDVPTTGLLRLQHRFEELRALVFVIPTLDPAKGFRPDPQRGNNIFRARDVTKPRTKKVQKPLRMAPPTDKHPEQVQLITEDVVVGTITEQEWSSLITPATKGLILDRIEEVTRALKKAQARANSVDVDISKRPGKSLLEFVFQPLA